MCVSAVQCSVVAREREREVESDRLGSPSIEPSQRDVSQSALLLLMLLLLRQSDYHTLTTPTAAALYGTIRCSVEYSFSVGSVSAASCCGYEGRRPQWYQVLLLTAASLYRCDK